jgi:hypothetical protein
MTWGTHQEGANGLIAFLHAHHNLIYDFLSVLCNCAVVDSIRLGPVVFAHRWRRIFDQLQG